MSEEYRIVLYCVVAFKRQKDFELSVQVTEAFDKYNGKVMLYLTRKKSRDRDSFRERSISWVFFSLLKDNSILRND